MENLKEEFKEKIKSNIEQYGHHNTIVHSGTVPRFAYTIGLKKHFEIELIFAGGIYFMQDEIMKIINGIAVHVKQFGLIDNVAVSSFGLFKLSRVHQSWSKLTALGCFDFYNTNEIQLYQIIPDTEHFTLDIPNMSLEWNSISQPIWKWLSEKWDYPIPEDSTVITNLNALRGKCVTEVMRWETGEWEAFAGNGPDVEKQDIRIIPIGTLLGIDKSLTPILDLKVGKGIWRDTEDLVWNEWN